MASAFPAEAERGVVDDRNPYAGLQSFTEQDASYFFGREREAEQLFRLVRRGRLTVLFGASGLGKSSLLRAGLFPLLDQARFLPFWIRLDFAREKPDLVSQIHERLAQQAECYDACPPDPKQTLWEYFHRETFWDATNHPLTPVLVLDQFEEIFTLGREPGARQPVRALLTELADLIENQVPAAVRARLAGSDEELPFSYDAERVKVILTLREDYLPALEDLRGRIPSLVRNRFRLTSMDGLQAKQAVLGPAPELVTEAVADDIVRYAAGASAGEAEEAASELEALEVEPALLSLVCQQLNERRREKGLDAISKDLLSGAREEIYEDFYEHSVEDLPAGVRAFIEDDLITASGFRTAKALEDAERRATPDAIAKLVDRRVLRLVDRGVMHVELIHDVLTPVVEADRDRRVLVEAARRRNRRMLLGGGVAAALAFAAIGFLAYQDRENAKTIALLTKNRALAEYAVPATISSITMTPAEKWSKIDSLAADADDEQKSRLAPVLEALASLRDTLGPEDRPFHAKLEALQTTLEGADGESPVTPAVTWELLRLYQTKQSSATLDSDEDLALRRLGRRVDFSATVNAPRDERVRLVYLDSSGAEAKREKQATTTPPSPSYTVHDWHNFSPGSYEVRVYNQDDLLIGRRDFRVD
jgi:hypothetical protein